MRRDSPTAAKRVLFATRKHFDGSAPPLTAAKFGEKSCPNGRDIQTKRKFDGDPDPPRRAGAWCRRDWLVVALAAHELCSPYPLAQRPTSAVQPPTPC